MIKDFTSSNVFVLFFFEIHLFHSLLAAHRQMNRVRGKVYYRASNHLVFQHTTLLTHTKLEEERKKRMKPPDFGLT
jgi:hypothetical protein